MMDARIFEPMGLRELVWCLRAFPVLKFFCTIDCVSGYHQIAVDDASSDLLVKATPSRRYRMKVLAHAQGVTSASDVFNIFTDGNTRPGWLPT